MRYGVREICDVVLKAKDTMTVGNKKFYKHEPVIYFDTLKTSSLEGASTTVYAQGGAGNARLIAWEGERTVTFNMEDALISPTGFMILSGAGLVEAKSKEPIIVHTTEPTSNVTVAATGSGADRDVSAVTVYVSRKPYLGKDGDGNLKDELTGRPSKADDSFIYVMVTENGEVITEPYIPVGVKQSETKKNSDGTYMWELTLDSAEDNLEAFPENANVLVDYYVAEESGAFQIEITPDSFGGNFYLEASTLFRDTNGSDKPAEFIIPNCKIQSNFTFTMASSGDPSSFNFVMDAFPDYTRFNPNKKVLAAIQVIGGSVGATTEKYRTETEDGYGATTT